MRLAPLILSREESLLFAYKINFSTTDLELLKESDADIKRFSDLVGDERARSCRLQARREIADEKRALNGLPPLEGEEAEAAEAAILAAEPYVRWG